MRIYIAGPMRGLPDYNHPAFNRATERFRIEGHEVDNPVEIGERLFMNNPSVAGGEYLRADVQVICHCDAIALLPGWERSTGARCEVACAITFGLDFYDAETMQFIKPPARVVVAGGYERWPGAVESLDQLREESIAFANATFIKATPYSKSKHLVKEANELHAKPTDTEEMADVFLLLAHLSDGYDLAGAVRTKLEINKTRTWGEPDADGVVEHLEDAAA